MHLGDLCAAEVLQYTHGVDPDDLEETVQYLTLNQMLRNQDFVQCLVLNHRLLSHLRMAVNDSSERAAARILCL